MALLLLFLPLLSRDAMAQRFPSLSPSPSQPRVEAGRAGGRVSGPGAGNGTRGCPRELALLPNCGCEVWLSGLRIQCDGAVFPSLLDRLQKVPPAPVPSQSPQSLPCSGGPAHFLTPPPPHAQHEPELPAPYLRQSPHQGSSPPCDSLLGEKRGRLEELDISENSVASLAPGALEDQVTTLRLLRIANSSLTAVPDLRQFKYPSPSPLLPRLQLWAWS